MADSEMSRALLIAEYFIKVKQKPGPDDWINGVEPEEEDWAFKIHPIYIATSHFESMDNQISVKNRVGQLHDTLDVILGDEPNCIICGDFNFDNQ